MSEKLAELAFNIVCFGLVSFAGYFRGEDAATKRAVKICRRLRDGWERDIALARKHFDSAAGEAARADADECRHMANAVNSAGLEIAGRKDIPGKEVRL